MDAPNREPSSDHVRRGRLSPVALCAAVLWFLLALSWYFSGYVTSLKPFAARLPWLQHVLGSEKP